MTTIEKITKSSEQSVITPYQIGYDLGRFFLEQRSLDYALELLEILETAREKVRGYPRTPVQEEEDEHRRGAIDALRQGIGAPSPSA